MILVKTKLDKSGIHGIGLFAVDFIAKDTPVWEFNKSFDLILSKSELDKLSPPSREQFLNYAYISKRTGRYILCSDDARFFNHASDANTKCFVPDNFDSEEALLCIASRDISPGEELTNNYAEFDADPSDVTIEEQV